METPRLPRELGLHHLCSSRLLSRRGRPGSQLDQDSLGMQGDTLLHQTASAPQHCHPLMTYLITTLHWPLPLRSGLCPQLWPRAQPV